MICQICGKDFIDTRLGSHITRVHKLNLEDYYCTYLGEKGKCLTCGKPTSFINMLHGYCRFCCNKCVGLNKDIQAHKKQTTLNNFGVEWPTQSKEVKQTIQNVLETKYGCQNSYNIPSIKEKAQKNSHTKKANEKRGKNLSKTLKILLADINYKNAIKEKAMQTNLKKYGYIWSSNSKQIRQKISNTVKSKDCQNRTKATCLKKYGVTHHTQSQHYIRTAKKRYLYNNISFDSSWELAFYIWHIDQNIHIVRSPCTIKYKDLNNEDHMYTPDFLVKNQLIEIKGNQFFDKDGNLINIYTHKIAADKLLCMKEHNVKMLRYNDIKFYLQYCADKYNTNDWYKQFRKN